MSAPATNTAMSCKVTVDGPCRRTLSFTVERQEIDREIEQGAVELARTTRFKGFRAGKVPLSLVRRKHGEALAEEARRKVMGQAFQAALKEHDLHPVGDPVMNLEKLEDDGKGPFTFEFDIEVAPEIEIDLEARIPVTVTLPPVTTDMVDAEVQRLREQAATIEDVPEGEAVAQDDVLEGTAVFVVDGAELEPRTERAVFTKHDLVDGIPVEGSGALFVGRNVGDTVEVETALPDHFEPPEHAGKSATIRFTIQRNRRVKPAELNEETLKRMGVSSEQELRSRIEEGLGGQRANVRTQLVDRELDKYLLARHTFDVPERLMQKNIDHRVHEYAHHLMKEQGLSSEDGHGQAEEKREQITDVARDGLRLAFIIRAIARENDLSASMEDAEAQVRTIAGQQQADPNETLIAAYKEGWIGDVQEQLTQDKTRRWLRERADVTEQDPPPADDETKTAAES